LLRASNTQPVLVMRFEARTPERLLEIQRLVVDRLHQIAPQVQVPR
jgi:phosphomannomutase/phosphoglucomutase